MRKKYQTLVLHLTQYILEEYWQGNLTPLKEHLHKDIHWIGSMDEEYIHGKEAMLKRINENQNEMPPVYMDQQEYGIVLNQGNVCVVTGRYRAYTKPESQLLLSEKQRVTFVWEKVMIQDIEKFLIKHIHLSNIFTLQGDDERFPTKLGRDNYEYMKKIMAERSRDAVISLKDENLSNRIINYSDIMYLRAEDNYVRIYLGHYQGNFRVRGKFSEFMEKMPEGFIKVSRSIGINRSYVKSVHGRELIMIDDMVFQIPAAVCSQVQREITRKEES